MARTVFKGKTATLIFTRTKRAGDIFVWNASLGVVKIPRTYSYFMQFSDGVWKESFITSITPKEFKRLFGFTLPKGKQISGNITLCTASRK